MKKIELIRQVIIAWKLAYIDSEIAKYTLGKMHHFKDNQFTYNRFDPYYDRTLNVPSLNEEQNKYLSYVLNNGECHLTAAVLYGKLREVIGDKLSIVTLETQEDNRCIIKAHSLLKVGDYYIDSLAVTKANWFAETTKDPVTAKQLGFNEFTDKLFQFDPDGKALFDSFVTEKERNFVENN